MGTFKVVDLLGDGDPFQQGLFHPDAILHNGRDGQLSHAIPASFMILLKHFRDFRQDSATAWSLVLKETLEYYLNRTHQKLKHALQNMDSANLAYIRDLTAIKDESWEMNLLKLSEIDNYLLNIGILVSLARNKGTAVTNRVSFSSNVIFRVVFEMVWPQPRKSLPIPMQAVTDPLLLLIYITKYHPGHDRKSTCKKLTWPVGKSLPSGDFLCLECAVASLNDVLVRSKNPVS
ncbi:6942_t:CDS:2 [Ambispora gerdemannii]|uniref:6942_t:CDS:1 n=1 Tax=Ambispora gerdemannii TaxID=144530 RepID=A0A9N9CFP5_9GLOM|nr:6942_t:CDS:2 [Ambispora gerdemannii]